MGLGEGEGVWWVREWWGDKGDDGRREGRGDEGMSKGGGIERGEEGRGGHTVALRRFDAKIGIAGLAAGFEVGFLGVEIVLDGLVSAVHYTGHSNPPTRRQRIPHRPTKS